MLAPKEYILVIKFKQGERILLLPANTAKPANTAMPMFLTSCETEIRIIMEIG